MNLLFSVFIIRWKIPNSQIFFFLESVQSVGISVEKKSVLDFADGP